MDGCLGEGGDQNYAYCNCTMNELMKKYDDETATMESVKFALGNASDEFMEAFTAAVMTCMNYYVE